MAPKRVKTPRAKVKKSKKGKKDKKKSKVAKTHKTKSKASKTSTSAKGQRAVRTPKARKPREPKPAKEAALVPAAGSASPAADAEGEIEDQVRSRVVGLLMRTAAQKVGQASFEICQKIEASLFRQFGEKPKEYRARARSLSMNLGRPDGRLLEKVIDGRLSAAQLAGLSGEDLAPEAVRIAKAEERERYFRSEVHLTAGPPKRKRDLFPGTGPHEDEQPLLRRRSSRRLSNAPAAEEEANTAKAEDAVQLSSSSSSSSSSGSSSSSSSSESLWEDDLNPLPLVDDEGEQEAEEGRGQTASSSSTAAPPEAAVVAAPAAAAGASPRPAPSEALQTLVSMGFNDVKAMQALGFTCGDLDRAIAKLLGEA